MKKWIIIIASIAIIGFIGYRVGMNYVSDVLIDKVADEVLNEEEIEKLAQDPEIKKLIEENLTEEQIQSLLPAGSEPAADTEPQSAGETSEDSADVPAASKQDASTSGQGRTSDAAEQPAAGTGSEKPASSTTAPSKPKVMTKEEATTMIMGKFSVSEINGYRKQAADGLSDEEKQNLKAELQQRLTEQEYQDLRVLALMEIAKRSAG